MKGSKWLIFVVVLIVVAVVIAKQVRDTWKSPQPTAVARGQTGSEAPPSAESEEATSASPAGTKQQPVPKPEALPPAAKPARVSHTLREQPISPAESKRPGKPAPNPTSRPGAEQRGERKPALGPKPKGPLPGSKLKECLRNGLPTMADFGLGTCKPCKAMEPILRQAAQDYWGRANILFVELDKYSDLAREYRIRLMPTQIFFDASGNQVDSHMGYMDREEIDRRLAALGVKR
jgi:thioredoxin 1